MNKIWIFRNLLCNVFIAVVIISLVFVGFAPKSVAVDSANSPIYKGSSSDKVSLMVNVYWGEEFIDDMLAIFRDKEIKVTFFVGGSWVEKNENTFLKIVNDGHEIGNHGYFHKDHKKLSLEQNTEEISATHNLVKRLSGKEMTLFAPPSGSFNDDTLLSVSRLGYVSIMWSKDTIDWRDQDEKVILRRATKNLTAGDLILMHPTKATLSALESIIDKINETGLKIAPVSEVIYPSVA